MYTRIISGNEVVSEVLRDARENNANLYMNPQKTQAVLCDGNGPKGFIHVEYSPLFKVSQVLEAA